MADERLDELVEAANDVVDRLAVLWRLFRSYRRTAVHGELYIPGVRRDPNTMTFEQPDTSAIDVTLILSDARGRTGAAAPGPVTWSVSDPALANLTPHPDGLGAHIDVPLQTQGTYQVAASTGTLSGTAAVDIAAGAAAAATLELTLTPKASEAEAEQVHQGMHRAGHHQRG